MTSRKFKNIKLLVQAVPHADVREIDVQTSKPLLACRTVGKDNIVCSSGEDAYVDNRVIMEGVEIPYHSHYIAQLKNGSLKPMNLETAILAGVSFDQGNK